MKAHKLGEGVSICVLSALRSRQASQPPLYTREAVVIFPWWLSVALLLGLLTVPATASATQLNDNCAAAVTVDLPVSSDTPQPVPPLQSPSEDVSGTTLGSGEASNCGGTLQAVWFELLSAQENRRVTVFTARENDPSSSDYDTVLDLFSGDKSSCGSRAFTGVCNNDGGTTPTVPYASRITFLACATQKYLIEASRHVRATDHGHHLRLFFSSKKVPPGGDGDVCSHYDNCPNVDNDQTDSDHDGIGDACDDCPATFNPRLCTGGQVCPHGLDIECPDGETCTQQQDRDGDGKGDLCDLCPSDPMNDADQDGRCSNVDNCPNVFNPNQKDSDGDGVGDACDDDLDDDGYLNGDDNCPNVDNDQTDSDHDGIGDACDDDRDGDGIANDNDNCPDLANTDQADEDGDLVGDVCDPCPGDPGNDLDKDTICSKVDNCPGTANPDQTDSDGDGIGDACDNCPFTSNSQQQDRDFDRVGDACDYDRDGDGYLNGNDNCPDVANTNQLDSDRDGIGDACDDDLDNDGIANNVDKCPDLPNRGVCSGGTRCEHGLDSECPEGEKCEQSCCQTRTQFAQNFENPDAICSTDGDPSCDQVQNPELAWTAEGLWHLDSDCSPNPLSSSGPTSAYFGQLASQSGGCNYNTGVATSGRLTSPAVDLSSFALKGANLSFDYFLHTEGDCLHDKASVWILTDDGQKSTATEIADNCIGSAAECLSDVQGETGGSPNQPPCRLRLTDPSGEWKSVSIPIDWAVGAQMKVMFQFEAFDATANNFDGFHVDNVSIEGSVCLLQCPDQPLEHCLEATKSLLLMKGTGDQSGKLRWNWQGKPSSSRGAGFGDPMTQEADYQLCLYDQKAGLVLDKRVSGSKGWAHFGDTGYLYKDDAAQAGVTRILLRDDGQDHAEASVKGASAGLPLGMLVAPVRAQFFNSETNICIEGIYGAGAVHQSNRHFKAKFR